MSTSNAANTFFILQVALALLVNDKRVIETLLKFGITSTYHEFRRIKASSAAAADKNGLSSNMNPFDGLIQVITDKVDAAISPHNAMKQTHALASAYARANYSVKYKNEFKSSRLKQEEIKSVVFRDIPLSIHRWSKKLKLFCYSWYASVNITPYSNLVGRKESNGRF